MKKKKIVFTIITAFILIIGLMWFLWVGDYYRADVTFSQVSGNNSLSTIQNNSQIEFFPNNMEINTGLIIYPGAKVDFKAYAPAAKAIAEKGYKVIVVKMPQNLAIFGSTKADKVIADNPDIKNWAIAGHSLGGVIAAQYASANSDVIKGVIFWASYPSKDLSGTTLKTLTLYGTNDGFVKDDKINKSQELLPKDAVVYKIDGGNHSYFGYYGFQKGDKEALITREEQQEIITDKTSHFLSLLNK